MSSYSTVMAKKAAAAEKMKNRAEHGVSSGPNGGGTAQRIKLGDIQTFPPFDVDISRVCRIPKDEPHNTKFAKRRVRLLPVISEVTTHRIRKAANSSVLEKRHQSHPEWKDFACTFDATAGPRDLATYEPNAGWVTSDDGSQMLLEGNHGHVIEILRTTEKRGPNAGRHVYEIKVGSLPIQPWDRDLIDWGFPSRRLEFGADLYETDDDAAVAAAFYAEKLLAMAGSCAFCAENVVEVRAQVGKDERIVQRASPALLMGFTDLTWHKVSETKTADGKYTNYKIEGDGNAELPVTRYPDGAVVHIRGHRGRIPLLLEGTGKRAETMRKLEEYSGKLARICKHCIPASGCPEDGRHVIKYQGIYCENCGEIHYGVVKDESVEGGETPVPMDEAYLNDDPAYLTQALSNPLTCAACGHLGPGRAQYACNTCDKPTPTGISDVITEVTAVRLENSTYHAFDVFRSSRIPGKPSRLLYREQDWQEMATAAVGGQPIDKVENWPATIAAAAATYGDPSTYDSLIRLNGATQAELLQGVGIPPRRN